MKYTKRGSGLSSLRRKQAARDAGQPCATPRNRRRRDEKSLLSPDAKTNPHPSLSRRLRACCSTGGHAATVFAQDHIVGISRGHDHYCPAVDRPGTLQGEVSEKVALRGWNCRHPSGFPK